MCIKIDRFFFYLLCNIYCVYLSTYGEFDTVMLIWSAYVTQASDVAPRRPVFVCNFCCCVFGSCIFIWLWPLFFSFLECFGQPTAQGLCCVFRNFSRSAPSYCTQCSSCTSTSCLCTQEPDLNKTDNKLHSLYIIMCIYLWRSLCLCETVVYFVILSKICDI